MAAIRRGLPDMCAKLLLRRVKCRRDVPPAEWAAGEKDVLIRRRFISGSKHRVQHPISDFSSLPSQSL